MDILEIEIKAYCDDLKQVADAVTGMGAARVVIREEEDVYFNHPARDFGTTDEALRIRSTGRSSILTYKGPKLGERSKTRLEEEVEVDNFLAMKRILEHLGFVESGSVAKVRDIYRLGDIDICVDRVEDVGTFIELEKKGTERESVEKELFELAAKLGLDRFERKSYLELKMGW
ncbi:MAG: class IV adenylate cyclase [bacterium]|nr:class IV adenylate cyclase [bacterium]